MDESLSSKPSLSDRLISTVRQVMQVLEVVEGGQKDAFAVRFRGQLMLDSQQAFDKLQPAFAREGVTLLLRQRGTDHLVIALRGVARPRASNPWVNLILFLLTVVSMMLAGVLPTLELPPGLNAMEVVRRIFVSLPQGLPFAVSLLAILLAHEFGHYLAARYHRTPVTLPYFIPFPGSPFGTMGAFIQLKEPPRNRRVLLDIGLAGPLAGLVVAIPVLLVGLALSEVSPLPQAGHVPPGFVLEGNSLLYLLAKYVVKGQLLPAPVSYGGVPPLLYWIRYVFVGLPAPFGGQDVLLHPVAWAGWAGLLVTSLNLLPVGQLDGGHVIFVLFGRKATLLWPVVTVALVLLGLAWPGWWLWAALVFFLGRAYAQPLDDITPLNGWKKALAIAGLLIFILVFIPVPMRTFGGL